MMGDIDNNQVEAAGAIAIAKWLVNLATLNISSDSVMQVATGSETLVQK